MSRNRDTREAKALAYLRRHGCASAMDMGSAALQGEPRTENISRHGRESIGLSIAMDLARRGIILATRRNHFRLP